jgi:hypothetical protein
MPADYRPEKDKSVKQTIGRQVASKGTLLPNAPGSAFASRKGAYMLAPIILGFLTSRRDGAGSSGIASLLNQGANDSILDDVAGLFLGGLTGGGSSGGGGILGSLLGGLMGSKCGRCGRKLESDFKYCPECGNRR